MTTTTDSTSDPTTPRPRAPPACTTELTALLGQMNVSLGTIGATFAGLREQSGRLAGLGPTLGEAGLQIRALHREMKREGRRQEEAVLAAKGEVLGLRAGLGARVRDYVQAQLRAEVGRQVGAEVGAQMGAHLGVTLEQQAADTQEQLRVVGQSLVNSEARRANGGLCATYLNEPLETVLKADGERSRVFPANLRSLFAYEEDMVKELVRDYGLRESEEREENLKRFMEHIGLYT